jgi:putative integral membrane protein (TIGR02587 family)
MTDETRRIAVGYARGAMGGLLVGVPAFMTMEIWWGGFAIPATRLLLLAAMNYAVLLLLQHYSGTTHRKTFGAEARAALVTLGLGVVISFLSLFALGVLHGDIHLRELAGKLLLETVPVSIGASVATSEFGVAHDVADQRRNNARYWDSMGMAIGGAMLIGDIMSHTELARRD